MARRRRSVLELCLLSTVLVAPFPAAGSENFTYAYDARGRLVQVSRSGNVNNGVQANYSYDNADNRTGVTVSTGAPLPPSFSVSDVTAGEGATLVFTVTKAGSTSSPLNVDVATADGNAVAGTDYTSTSATLTFAAADTSKTVSVPTAGNGIVDGIRKFYLNLTNPSGGSALSDAQGLGTISDDEVAVVPSFSVADVSATEGNSLTFTVAKTGLTNLAYTIDVETGSGTAKLGSDYIATSDTLTFGPSDTQKTVTVSTAADTAPENNETFAVNLRRPSGGATMTDGAAVGTILNDDGTGISITNAAGTEGDVIGVTVTRVGDTSGTITVNWATANGSATAPTDYTSGSGTLTFSPGVSSRTINISTFRQTIDEGGEIFTISLSQGTGTYTITRAQAQVEIIDYIEGCDPPPGQEPSCFF